MKVMQIVLALMKDRDSSLMAGMTKGYDKSRQVVLLDSSHKNPIVVERYTVVSYNKTFLTLDAIKANFEGI